MWDGARKTKMSVKIISIIAMVCLLAAACVGIANATTEESSTTDTNQLLNGSFEEGQTWTGSYKQPAQSEVPAWNTTAFQGKIELFRENTGTYIQNVKLSPTDGLYAAELNADEESTLYQNIKTTPSSVYEWGLDHGARNGTDTMALVIGPKQSVNPSKPNKDGRDQLMQMIDWLIAQGKTTIKTSAGLGEKFTLYSKKFGEKGTFEDNAGNNAFSLTPSTIYTEEWHIWIMASSRATSGTNPWNSYGANSNKSEESVSSGNDSSLDLSKYYLYTVPAGQTNTLFGFVSVGYVDSTISGDKAKTYGNFLDNINFQIYHPLTGSTTSHGSAVVGESGGSSGGAGSSEGHEVTIDHKLATYVPDGQPLKIQAIIRKQDVDDGCQFIGVYYTKLDDNGNPVSVFVKLDGNEIEYSESLTEEQKKGKWIKSYNEVGDIIYTYYLDNIVSSTNLHFIFIKNPTVTYDPNGGKAYIMDDRQYNTDEEPNVYSFKPVANTPDTQLGTDTTFIPPYVSKAAEGQNDGWKFTGWKLTGDIVEYSGDDKVNADQLGSMILPAVHTIACDYSMSGALAEQTTQYFKIYGGNAPLTKTVRETESGARNGVIWQENEGVQYDKQYANIHRGLTMVAQWRWRQAIIPQSRQENGEYSNSDEGGTVVFKSVTDESKENYNPNYNDNGGKSYFAATDETVIIKANANVGWKFIGWYDENDNLVSTNDEYRYFEPKESVKTYYARFSNSITQTYIRQLKNGDSWDNITGDTIATLGRYSYTDAIGMPISSTVLSVGTGYKFLGWYDSNGNKVPDNMLTNEGKTISYTTTEDATYYARFETLYTLNVKKIDGDNSTPLDGAEFNLYRKATAEESADSGITKKTLSYNGSNVRCVLIESKATVLSGGLSTASFSNLFTVENEYYLTESKVPVGYKPLFDPIKITFNNTGTIAYVDGTEYTIINREFNIELKNYLLPDMHFTKTADKTNVTKNEKVAYTISVDIPDYPDDATDKSFYVSDLLPDGLTIDTDSISVKADGTAVSDTVYTLDTAPTSKYTFKLSVDTSQYAAGWSENGGKKLEITYDATFNDDSTTSVNSPETNTATFDYTINPYLADRHVQVTASVDVKTFAIKINKYVEGDESTKLADAKFDLYRTATQTEIDGGLAVTIPYTSIDGIKLEGDKVTDENGVTAFEKYEANADRYDYYVVEVEPPPGYIYLIEAIKVNFAESDVDANGYYTVDITNRASVQLPITGGNGTVIFFVSGIAAIGAALTAYIIYRRKIKSKENK